MNILRAHRLSMTCFLAWCSYAPTCLASGHGQPTCPDQIAASSITIKPIGGAWTSHVTAPFYLHAVAPADGPPERLGQLVGQHADSARGTWTDTYDLTGPFPEGKWLQCSYGMLNEVVLSQRLDDRISTCTIKGRKGEKAGQNAFIVTCR